MQLLGIFLNEEYKCLKKEWYGFCSDVNWHDKFIKNEITDEVVDELSQQQLFLKQFYNYQGNQISISAIVGKNGAGKSTLLELYNKIINNFAYKIKTSKKFKKYNEDYDLTLVYGIHAELFYENNKKIYRIIVNDSNIKFSNNKTRDLFKVMNNLDDLSEHCFYTVSTNYSLYYKNENWTDKLFHKNDGYFTPIVLVPFRHDGNIEFEREKRLAEKRVMTLSLLLYKTNTDFIEDYIPSFIGYELKNEEYYKRKRYEEKTKFKNYEEEINEKISDLQKSNEVRNEYRTKPYISNKQFPILKEAIELYWEDFFKKKKKEEIYTYCKLYLIYKTLKSFTNYESLAKLLDFKKISQSVSDIIKKELWDENNINYINLKILTCKRFIEYTFKALYKEKDLAEIKKQFFSKKRIKKADNYHEIFSYLLPDFYEVHCHYIKKDEKKGFAIELSDMSSGEQQLYNSLSYVVYHMKNAQSNQKGTVREKIPYKNFNLFIDEAEVYYHPEYQRRFITDLVNLLNRSNIGISGLSVTIVSHSPYIISDIPRNNILALENGKVTPKLMNQTLAANVYDLLGNQFFMESYIGECSKKLIETIVKNCKSDTKIDPTTYNFYKSFIDLIGDDYLKPTLTNMLEEKMGSDFKTRKQKYYEAKLSCLNG